MTVTRHTPYFNTQQLAYEAETAIARYRANRLVTGLMVLVIYRDGRQFSTINPPWDMLQPAAASELREFIEQCDAYDARRPAADEVEGLAV